MKKSMKMVSVIMSAVMAMSAMSALAAGASAEELPAEPETTVTETTDTDTETTVNSDYEEATYDASIEHGYIPVTVTTDGINGRLNSMSVTVEYEFTTKATNPEVRGIMYAHPETKCKDAGNGNVTLSVTEKRTFTDDSEISFNVPANVDMQQFSIKVDYNSITGDHNLFKYYLADSHVNGAVNDISIDLDATTWVFSYDVTGSVYVNGELVHSAKD